ncbi:MAG: DUF72 domain-containing protein [Actinomycetota bacterium]
MAGTLYTGTSGYVFDQWKGVFYPEGLSPKRWLTWYASVLPSVEINYTFRRVPSEDVVARWRDQTPPHFRFTLKAHQRITHYRRLEGAGEYVDELVRAAAPLGERLGIILFQLPPNLKYEADRLAGFLRELPSGPRYAMEFRHDSWYAPEVDEALAAHGVARCGADTDAVALEAIPVTAGHVYLRFRREAYTDRSIASWRRRIRPLLAEGRDVFCYFKHEDGGKGPVWARALQIRRGEGAPR